MHITFKIIYINLTPKKIMSAIINGTFIVIKTSEHNLRFQIFYKDSNALALQKENTIVRFYSISVPLDGSGNLFTKITT